MMKSLIRQASHALLPSSIYAEGVLECNLFIFFIILFLSVPINSKAGKDKTVTTKTGSSFTIRPYSDAGLSGTNTCVNTSINYSATDASAFSISEATKSTTTYKIGSNTYKGNCCTYNVKALKEGTYTIKATVVYMPKSTGNTIYLSTPSTSVTYHVTVSRKKVVTSITIPTSIEVFLGDSYTFSPVIAENGAKTTLSWSSSNSNVASVTSEGVLTALTIGNTIVTCAAANGVAAQCQVTIRPVLVTEITLNKTECNMQVGDNFQLTTTISPDNATNHSVFWSSSDENVAIVDDNGVVTALASGTTQIKATANDGSGKSAACKITVDKNNNLSISEMKVCKGGSGTLHVALIDEDIISGFQFDLSLPDGITVSTGDNDKLVANLTSRTKRHSISSRKISDGLYRFVVVSMSGNTITKGKDDVMTVSLDVAETLENKDYNITIKDIALTVKDGSSFYEVHPRNNKAILTVTDALLGDVTGDDIISVTDVISIISYVLEEEPISFLKPAADLNDDGNITVTDAAIVIDMILDNQ